MNQIEIKIPKGETIGNAIRTAIQTSVLNNGVSVHFVYNGLPFTVGQNDDMNRVLEVYEGTRAMLYEIGNSVDRIIVRRMADMDPPDKGMLDLKAVILAYIAEQLDKTLGPDLQARANRVAGLADSSST